jgi:hypothetical protein
LRLEGLGLEGLDLLEGLQASSLQAFKPQALSSLFPTDFFKLALDDLRGLPGSTDLKLR